jgi:membrane fusion protein (multidrug efflux system)
MFVDVELVTQVRDDALLVPKRAVLYDDELTFVYRVNEDRRAQRVRIRPALSDPEHVVPAEGLEEGDRVVVAGQAGLKDRALVELAGEKENAPAEPEAPVQEASL